MAVFTFLSQLAWAKCPSRLQHEHFQETIAESAFSRKLLDHWSNCIDHAYAVCDLIDDRIFQGHALARLKSSDQDIRAANHLLRVDKAHPACARSYRLVAETLLKAVGWQSGVITSKAEERRTFGHGLKDLAKEWGQKTGARFFHEIPASVSVLPSWRSRYEESVEDNPSLWQAVFLAQSIAADVVRLYSERNVRSQICQWVKNSSSRPPTPPAP